MAAKKGPRGRSVPCPDWWVQAVRAHLGKERTIKALAKELDPKGDRISETMVVRCIHEDPDKRLSTLEVIEAISDHLGLPSCVVIARDQAEALAIRGAVALRKADADLVKIAAGVAKKPR
jgi:hypothetical protein